jgi:VanZ family protein
MTTSPIFRFRHAILRWIPASCFATAIFIFSAVPGHEVTESYHNVAISIQTITSAISTVTPETTPAEVVAAPAAVDLLKAAHGIGYFCLGISVLYALSAHLSHWSPSVALILCCLYSFTDEFHQIFTPGRSASPKDILLDTLASLIGVAIMLGVMASRTIFNQKQAPAG